MKKMNVSKGSIVKLNLLGLLGLLLATVVAFQNCGQFQAAGNGNGSFSSSGQSQVIRVSAPSGRVNQALQAAVSAQDVAGSIEILWDHEFGDGSVFCSQTTSPDRLSTSFLCREAGRLKILLSRIDAQGNETVEAYEVTILAEGEAEPTPGPGALTGAQLYTNNCSGCHGPIASSTKRGRTLPQLNAAISSVGTMQGLMQLTTAERQAIIDAL